ncbi:MAG: hypothetical protein WBA41_19720 [Rivularia sp. (in: cyanobacteria)]
MGVKCSLSTSPPFSPSRHLPTRTWMGGSQWWRHADTFAAKLENLGGVMS